MQGVMTEFSDMLFDNIRNGKTYKFKSRPEIERVPPFELRSEMLENIGERIIHLIEKEGYKPSDIVVISNYADPVTEFVIARALENRGYEIKNLTRKNRVIDNPFSQGLITLAQLCHPTYGFMPEGMMLNSYKGVLKIDPIRSSMLAGEVLSQRPFAQFPDIEFPGLVRGWAIIMLKNMNILENG